MEWMASLVDNPEEYQPRLHQRVRSISYTNVIKGHMLYRNLKNRMYRFMAISRSHKKKRCGRCYHTLNALKYCLTKDVCKYFSYDALYRVLFDDAEYYPMYKDAYKFVKKLYMQRLGITDEKTLELAEKSKISGSFILYPSGMQYKLGSPFFANVTYPDKAALKKRKQKEAIAEQKRKAKEVRQKKFEQEEGKVKWGADEKRAFKSALEEKFGPLQKPDSESQNQIQNHENSKSDK